MKEIIVNVKSAREAFILNEFNQKNGLNAVWPDSNETYQYNNVNISFDLFLKIRSIVNSAMENMTDSYAVIGFIRSNECKSADDLERFVRGNSLPFFEKYLYYLSGKTNMSVPEDYYFSDENYEKWSFSNAINRLDTIAGFWKKFLQNEVAAILEICERVLEQRLLLSGKSISFIEAWFFQMGWDYVDEEIVIEENRQENEDFTKNYDMAIFQEEEYNPYQIKDDYCGACEQTPCMCSDPT